MDADLLTGKEVRYNTCEVLWGSAVVISALRKVPWSSSKGQGVNSELILMDGGNLNLNCKWMLLASLLPPGLIQRSHSFVPFEGHAEHQSPTICSIKWCISSHVDLEHVSTSSLFPHISVCNAVRWAAVAQGAQGCWGPYCPHPHGTHRALVQCYWTSWVIVVGIIHDALLAHFIEVSLGSCRSSGTQLVDIHRAHFYCRNTQFSNCSLKNEVAFSCLNEKCMFSLTFWQLHCKTEQHHAWANRAWGSARLLSSLLFELVLSSSRVNSFLGKKGKNEWSDGSVLPAQCWSAVNALCFLYSVPADCELCRWGQTLRKRWVFA